MPTPPHVIAYRVVTVALATVILAAVGFGLAGRGPLGVLGADLHAASTQSTGMAP
jgi:hypothetical protein